MVVLLLLSEGKMQIWWWWWSQVLATHLAFFTGHFFHTVLLFHQVFIQLHIQMFLRVSFACEGTDSRVYFVSKVNATS